MDPQSTQPDPVELAQKRPFNKKTFIFFVLFLTLIAFVVGGFVLGAKEDSKTQRACTMEAKICPDGSSVGRSGPNCEFAPCPMATPAPIFKTYKNEKYGFEVSYPIKGVAKKDEDFTEAYCGNAIRETSDAIFIDNLFKIQIVEYSKTLDDYIVQRGAKNTYEFEAVENSNADEAVKVLGIKKGLELTSVGYPPLMYVSYIYKKNNWIFLIVHETHPPNPTVEEGCINPKDLDPNKFPEYANDSWDVKDSFRFKEQGAESKFCGGLAGLPCPTGYKCEIDTETYPEGTTDRVGKCVKETQKAENCSHDRTKAIMSYPEAILIGESGCKGKLLENHFCNNATGTWWIDLESAEKKEGCNPACVIDVNTKKAEINWRCTGLGPR